MKASSAHRGAPTGRLGHALPDAFPAASLGLTPASDLTYASNRAALYGTLAAAGVSLLLGRSWQQALRIAGVSMLGWATGRELDPDHPVSAALALGVSGVVGLTHTTRPRGEANMDPQTPAILPGLAALNATRLLTATVGAAVTPRDALALSAQAGLAAWRGHRLGALLPGAALAISATEPDDLRPEAAWSVPLALGAGLLPARSRPHPGVRRTMLSDLLSLGALSLGRTLTVLEQPDSRCDQAPRQVSASRLQASRMLSVGTLALGLVRGESGTLIPLAAATLSVGLRRRLPALEELGHF